MKSCCAETIVKMQEQVEAGKWLKLFLAATPFILILPDLVPARSARAAAAAVIEKMSVMTADQALNKINTGTKRPDFVDAIQAVDVIVLNSLSQLAAAHIGRHAGTRDGSVWSRLADAYSPAQPRGNAAPAGAGTESQSWFPWNWL